MDQEKSDVILMRLVQLVAVGFYVLILLKVLFL